MTADSNAQYMFGPDIIIAPVVAPADASRAKQASYPFQSLANKTAWLPPGTWFDPSMGVLIVSPAPSGTSVTRGYTLNEVPTWIRAGAVVPYLPLESFATLTGLARQAYSFLGFSITPGTLAGTGSVYEDDGTTTAYLTDNAFARTTCAYTIAADGSTATFTISTSGTYVGLPATRAYQLRLPNAGPIANVTVNGAAVPYVRYGTVAATGRIPASSQHYYDFSAVAGLGPVIDIVGASTTATTTVVIQLASPLASLGGAFGAIFKANEAKQNLDLDRTTPGSEQVGAAPLSVLASAGDALAYLAGVDFPRFAQAAASVPTLLAAAKTDVAKDNSPRTPHSLELLASVVLP